MKSFNDAEIRALAGQPSFVDDQSQRSCPACGAVSVRSYVHEFSRAGRPALNWRTWCASCRRMCSSVGAGLKGVSFSDPFDHMSQDERRIASADSNGFFDKLDRLWEQGSLPQTFQRRS